MRSTRRSSDRARRAKRLCTLLLLLPLLLCTGCGRSAEKREESLFAMDTVMLLTAYGENADAGLRAAAETIRELDALLSPERENSAVWRLNRGETVSDAAVCALADTCREIYAASGGALDPTVYPLVRLWGFIGGDYRVPSDAEIAALLGSVDYAAVTVSADGVSLPEGMLLSFGASAKGYAAQRAAEAMAAAGVESGILSLGGNVQTLGLKPDGSNWNVAIQDPNNTSSYLGVISVGERAIVTSGTYQRFFTDAKGNTYHHLISPTTGYPANNTLLSCTVITEDGTMADCLSTAMFVMGETNALNYWRANGGFEMILVTRSNEVICTKGLMEDFTLSNDTYTLTYKE